MRSEPKRYRAFAGVIMVAGIGVLAYLNGRWDVDSSFAADSSLILWMAMISVAAMTPIPLPRGSATFSLVPALELAAILLFGPAIACWVGVLARVLSNVAEKWNPFLPGLVKLGQSILAIGAGGIVYTTLGGKVGTELVLGTDQVLPLAAGSAAYFLAKTVIGTTEAALRSTRDMGQAVLGNLREAAPGDLALLPFGLLLAMTQVRIGPAGVALFLVPLLLARYFYKHWLETKEAHVHMVRTLMAAVDASDPLSWGHSYRVSKMALRLGRHLGLPRKELEELEFAALLHDIGRTAIRHDIILKPGRLTEQEQTLLRTHPRVGHDLLSGLRFFDAAAEIVHGHHEQPDGKGYPRGLAGDQIPVGSRIIMVVAAFDAMTSDRPYRRGLAPETAFDELLSHAGTQFFPDIVEALIQLYSAGTLYDEFEEAQLEQYAGGAGNSRAIEEFLKKSPHYAHVPEKLGLDAAPATTTWALAPIIEFPGARNENGAESTSVEELKTVTLKGKGTWKLEVAALSDVGCVREGNEDSYGIFDLEDASRGCLVVLADGMGGAAAGEIASRMAVDTVAAAFQDRVGRIPAHDALKSALKIANQTIHARASVETDLSGMGTTCTSASFIGRDVVLAHVGDSRAYIVKEGAISQWSQDHTLAAELGQLKTANAGVHPSASHVLTRALGTREEIEVDIQKKPLRLDPGQALVLCSDGLSNLVDDAEILKLVRGENPASACRSLVALAKDRGAPDNVTVVIARLQRS